MASQFWFRPKAYGYGTVPTSWQGWALTLGFAGFVAAMVVAAELKRLSPVWCLAAAVVVTVGFVVMAKAKTDGAWRWRRGTDDERKD